MSNVNQVSLSEMWPFMQEQLEAGKKVRFGPKGISMLPMLRQGVDTVVLTRAPEQLQKYDLPLFLRKNGQFVLHRVVDVRPDGYVMCGDNQFVREFGVKKENILAVVEGFYRGGEYVSCDNAEYRKYCVKRVRGQHVKWFVYRAKNRIKRLIRYNPKKN